MVREFSRYFSLANGLIVPNFPIVYQNSAKMNKNIHERILISMKENSTKVLIYRREYPIVYQNSAKMKENIHEMILIYRRHNTRIACDFSRYFSLSTELIHPQVFQCNILVHKCVAICISFAANQTKLKSRINKVNKSNSVLRVNIPTQIRYLTW